jgi:hypothetical protein
MRHLLLASLLAGAAVAQTTGVPGTNDLEVNGLGGGQASCVNLCFPNGNVALSYTVNGPVGAFVLIAFNFCPCSPCSLSGPANACVPSLPFTACGATTNQSLDLDTNAACGPLLLLVPTVTSAGTLALNINIPPIPGPPCTNVALSAQAVIFDPCGNGLNGLAGAFLVSQAITTWF